MAVVGFGPGEGNVPQSDSGLRVHQADEERLDVLVLRLDVAFFEQSSSGCDGRSVVRLMSLPLLKLSGRLRRL